jgi:hypothetical protein
MGVAELVCQTFETFEICLCQASLGVAQLLRTAQWSFASCPDLQLFQQEFAVVDFALVHLR